MKKMQFSVATIIFLFATAAQADPPILVDRQTGKYLGNLSSNRFDPDSVNNQFGRYGSRYSPDSPNNPYATNPPAIIHPGSGARYYYDKD